MADRVRRTRARLTFSPTQGRVMHRLILLAAALGCGLLLAVAATRSGTSPAQAAGTPHFSTADSSLTFDFVALGSTSATKLATIKNTGSAVLKFSAVEVGGRDAKDFKVASDSCTGVSVAVGATCAVGVQFTPSAAGTRVANLKFTDNTPCHDWITVAGSGDDTAKPLRASTATCEPSVDDALANAGTTVTNTTTTTTTTTTPAPALVSGSSVVSIQKSTTCESRRTIAIGLKAPKGKKLAQVKIVLHGKTIKTLKGSAIRTKVSLKGLPRGRFTLQVKATTTDGKHYTSTRHYVTCVASK
jgi:hypothetical protein